MVIIKSNDEPKPKNEVKYLAYYKDNKTNVKISKATRDIIEKYLEMKHKN